MTPISDEAVEAASHAIVDAFDTRDPRQMARAALSAALPLLDSKVSADALTAAEAPAETKGLTMPDPTPTTPEERAALHCARVVASCATHDQFIELLTRVERAIRTATAEARLQAREECADVLRAIVKRWRMEGAKYADEGNVTGLNVSQAMAFEFEQALAALRALPKGE